MKNQAKIFISITLLFLGKAVLDIILTSTFLIKYPDDYIFLNIIKQTIIIGLPIILVFNLIHRNYPFIYSLIYIALVLSSQYFLYFSYPLLLSQDISISSIPAFLIVGNILIIIFLNSFKQRLTEDNIINAEGLLNYGKYIGLILGGISTLIISIKFNIFSLFPYYLSSGILLLVAVVTLFLLILRKEEYNILLDNNQQIKSSNKLSLLFNNKYYLILLLFSLIIGGVVYLNNRIFCIHIQETYTEIREYIALFSYYSLALGTLGLIFEKLLKKKIKLHLGLKASLRIFPSFSIFLALIFLAAYNSPIILANSDWNYLFLITSIFLIILFHFSFENILWPTINSLYQPINISTRNDLYFKSYVFGIFMGVLFFCFVDIQLIIPNTNNQVSVIAYIIIGISITFIYLNQKPLYQSYQNQLQEYLNNQSQKIVAKQGLFRSANTEKTHRFKEIQFLRYINVLNLINPIINRQVISLSIKSDDNFNQLVSLIKADQLIYLELLDDLESLKKDKYFLSSPNRVKINHIIYRFEEINSRLHNLYVDQLSISKKTEERKLGAMLANFCQTNQKIITIDRLLKDPDSNVVLHAIIASNNVEDNKIISSIIDCLNNPIHGNAAFSTLLSCSKHVAPYLEEAFHKTGQKEKVQIRIIQLYGEISTEECVEYLIKKLTINNQNIISACLKALSKSKSNLSEEKKLLINHEVEELCQILIWNISIVSDIEKLSGNRTLIEAMQAEINNNYDNLFNLLSLLYNARAIELIKNNLFSLDHEKVAFALELAAVLLNNETKLLVVPLLQPTPNTEKIAVLMDKIPTEKLSLSDICHTLIQRESKWLNQWTKACAMFELAKIKNNENNTLLIANMINKDLMLSELASRSLFIADASKYNTNKALYGKKFPITDKSILDEIERSNTTKATFPVLRYDIIKFLQTIPEFSDIPGEILKHITNNIITIKCEKGEAIEVYNNAETQNYFYVLFFGKASLHADYSLINTFKTGEFISSIDLALEKNTKLTLRCDEDCLIYKIKASEFVELFTIYDIIPESIIQHTNNSSLKPYLEFTKLQKIHLHSSNQASVVGT